jgi:shikimate dehydrogenase
MEYGLIGEHLGHSYSPEIHAQLADYRYELREIEPDKLDAFMKAKDFKAINVTIPYKQRVILYLDEISPQAQKIGAVNTIVNRDGRLYGTNTDYAGMKALIEKLGLDLRNRKVLILGTGGTSRTAYAVAQDMGAVQICKVSRSGREGALTYDQAVSYHSDAQIIINTTPAGMYPDVETKAVNILHFPKLEGVVDAVYNPLRSELVQDAQAREIPAQGGLYMLAAQGVYACGEFLSRDVSAEDIDRVYANVLRYKRNVILIGMPSSGKSTVGRAVAAALDRWFYDTDTLVMDRLGSSMAESFLKSGEEEFRNKETEVIKELAAENGIVIAAGKGSVLREENVRALRRNGLLVFLDRPLDRLLETSDNYEDKARLKKVYADRIDIYRACADVTISADISMDGVAKAVLEVL